jgi:shikimate dehydrogenase
MNIRGASVTIPFKVDVMPYLDDVDPDALAIGAVNTIVNDSGRLTGYNTDWLGLIAALKEMTPITDKTFVIIGAGGTAAAAVYAIQKEGGRPVIVCRNLAKGKILSSRFGCPLYHLDDVEGIKRDCLINTTPVGMVPQSEESPVEASILSGYSCVADVIYHPLKTKLLRDAEERGCRIIPGIEMFVHQGAQQLKLWTGKEPPVALMKKTVLERLNKNEK